MGRGGVSRISGSQWDERGGGWWGVGGLQEGGLLKGERAMEGI